ncbi:hypothetical protein Tco_1534442, partial [Tanacetum coccineum]
KLDHFLLNEEFAKLWGNTSVVALDTKLSDHCPIVLKDVDLDFGPKPFRAFDIWLEEKDIRNVVEESWKIEVRSRRPDCRFRDKLKNVKFVLKELSKERFGAMNENIEMFKKEAMKWELEAENKTLREVRKEAWMKARKSWVDKENKLKEVVRHYKTLFFERASIRPIFCCDRVEKILVDDAFLVEKDFTEEEILEVVRACGGDKAPGPDGFNFKYIRKFWDILKVDLVSAIKWFGDKMEISRGCNSSFVTIIPKVMDPIGLRDFRPISLIGCYYKIIAKVLAERIKKVVRKV